MKDDMTPVTATQFEQLLQAALEPIKQNMATKEDLRAFEIAMKQESQWVRDRLEWLREGIDLSLAVFGKADTERKSEITKHERRIKRIEKRIGLATIA